MPENNTLSVCIYVNRFISETRKQEGKVHVQILDVADLEISQRRDERGHV